MKGKFHNTYAASCEEPWAFQKAGRIILIELWLNMRRPVITLSKQDTNGFKLVLKTTSVFFLRRLEDSMKLMNTLTELGTPSSVLATMAALQVLKIHARKHFYWKVRNEDAERVARRAVHALKRGGEQTVLAEALTTHGKALARLQQTQVARADSRSSRRDCSKCR